MGSTSVMVHGEPDDFFCTTDVNQTAPAEVETYAGRWSIEDTFKNTRQSFGAQTPQSRKKEGPERIAHLSFLLYLAIERICGTIRCTINKPELVPKAAFSAAVGSAQEDKPWRKPTAITTKTVSAVFSLRFPGLVTDRVIDNTAFGDGNSGRGYHDSGR